MKKSKDEFVDLREALQSIVRNQGVWRDLLEQISTSIEGTKQAKTIGEFINVVPKENSDWQKFQFGVSDQAVYSDDKLVERILQSMSKKAFSAISQKEGGTQFKLIGKSNVQFKISSLYGNYQNISTVCQNGFE